MGCQGPNSLSLRDAYMDAGGRAKHGAVAERAGVRGLQLKQSLSAQARPEVHS